MTRELETSIRNTTNISIKTLEDGTRVWVELDPESLIQALKEEVNN